jgi:hypothetical protein
VCVEFRFNKVEGNVPRTKFKRAVGNAMYVVVRYTESKYLMAPRDTEVMGRMITGEENIE